MVQGAEDGKRSLGTNYAHKKTEPPRVGKFRYINGGFD